MAQRRPITGHPAFAPLIALWFAALLGLVVAVLPASLLERALEAAGLAMLVPLTVAGRLIASGAVALLGAALGLGLALPLARRGRRDPRPIYDESELHGEDALVEEPIRRRPLHVREELADRDADFAALTVAAAAEEPRIVEADEGFMILTPQPVHPSAGAGLEGCREATMLAGVSHGKASSLPAAVGPDGACLRGAPNGASALAAPSPLGGLSRSPAERAPRSHSPRGIAGLRGARGLRVPRKTRQNLSRFRNCKTAIETGMLRLATFYRPSCGATGSTRRRDCATAPPGPMTSGDSDWIAAR